MLRHAPANLDRLRSFLRRWYPFCCRTDLVALGQPVDFLSHGRLPEMQGIRLSRSFAKIASMSLVPSTQPWLGLRCSSCSQRRAKACKCNEESLNENLAVYSVYVSPRQYLETFTLCKKILSLYAIAAWFG